MGTRGTDWALTSYITLRSRTAGVGWKTDIRLSPFGGVPALSLWTFQGGILLTTTGKLFPRVANTSHSLHLDT